MAARKRQNPKTPTSVLLKRGSWRGRQRAEAEQSAAPAPRLPVKAPTAPTWLSTEARREWKRVVPALEKLGILHEAHRGALVCLCESWSMYRRCDERLRELELGTQAAQYVAKCRAVEQAAYLRACSEFGLTPASLARVTPAGKESAKPKPATAPSWEPRLASRAGKKPLDVA